MFTKEKGFFMEITTDGLWVNIRSEEGDRKIKKIHFGNDLYALIKNQTPFQELEKKAVHRLFVKLLAKMDFSSQKLFQKAKAQGFDESTIMDVISQFKNKGLINDSAYEKRQRLKKIKKGFSCQVCKETSDEALELETEALKKLIQKKKKLLLSSEIKERQRAYRFFIMRGFSMNKINELLKQED